MADRCANCGRPLYPGAAFCPVCGTRAYDTGEENAAVSIELVFTGKTGSGPHAETINETTERFFAAADLAAERLNGRVTREEEGGIAVSFAHPGIAQAAYAAVSFAAEIRNATRGLVEPLPPALKERVMFRGGVNTLDPGTNPFSEKTSPRIQARRLRTKAADWTVLVSENVKALAGGQFDFRAVGFYQSAGGTTTVTVYELVEKPFALPGTSGGAIPPKVAVSARPREAGENFLAEIVKTRSTGGIQIIGPPGSGKSTLLSFFLESAKGLGFRIAAATFFPAFRCSPFAGWPGICRDLLRSLYPGRPVSKSVLTAVNDFGGDLALWAPLWLRWLGLEPEANPYTEEAPPTTRRLWTETFVKELVALAARRAPLALVFDDFQYAPSSSRLLIGSLASDHLGKGFALIRTTTEKYDFPTDAESLNLTPLEWRNYLEGLSDEGELELPSDPILFARSGGSPWALRQLWAYRKTPYALPPKEESLGGAAATALARRLSTKDKNWRATVAATAALGYPFSAADIPNLSRAAERNPDIDGEALVADLVALGLASRPFGGRENEVFLSDAAVAALNGLLTPTAKDRNAANKAAARFTAAKKPTDAAVRALLKTAAGDYATAAKKALAAAAEALSYQATDEATSVLTAVISVLDEDPLARNAVTETTRARLLLGRAETFLDQGVAVAVLADLDAAAIYDIREFWPALHTLRGKVFVSRGYYEEAEIAFRQAAESARRIGSATAAAIAELAQTDLARLKGDVVRARVLYQGAALKDLPPASQRSKTELQYRMADIQEAASSAHALLEGYSPDLRPYDAAAIGLVVGPILFETGRFGNAKSLLETSFRIYDTTGDIENSCRALANLARIESATEKVAGVKASWRKLWDRATGAGYAGGEFEAAFGLSQTALWEGDSPNAFRWLARAGELTESLPREYGWKVHAHKTLLEYSFRGATGAWRDILEVGRAYESIGDYISAGDLYLTAGRIGRGVADPADVRDLLRRPPLEFRPRESRYLFAEYAYVLALSAAGANDPQTARKYSRAAVAAARELGLWNIESAALTLLADVDERAAKREEYRRRARWLAVNGGAEIVLGLNITPLTAPKAA